MPFQKKTLATTVSLAVFLRIACRRNVGLLKFPKLKCLQILKSATVADVRPARNELASYSAVEAPDFDSGVFHGVTSSGKSLSGMLTSLGALGVAQLVS